MKTLAREIVFDIETIPQQDPSLRALIMQGLKPPANYKDPDKIAAWLEEEADKQMEKAALDGARCHVVAIGWDDGGERDCYLAPTPGDEADIISEFFTLYRKCGSPMLVGHNVAQFDIRILTQRAMVLGIRLPSGWPVDPKPWDRQIFDTMTTWAGARGTISMRALADAFGIPAKQSGITGADVHGLWRAGHFEAIGNYCMDDVATTRAIYERMRVALYGGDKQFTPDQPDVKDEIQY